MYLKSVIYVYIYVYLSVKFQYTLLNSPEHSLVFKHPNLDIVPLATRKTLHSDG